MKKVLIVCAALAGVAGIAGQALAAPLAAEGRSARTTADTIFSKIVANPAATRAALGACPLQISAREQVRLAEQMAGLVKRLSASNRGLAAAVADAGRSCGGPLGDTLASLLDEDQRDNVAAADVFGNSIFFLLPSAGSAGGGGGAPTTSSAACPIVTSPTLPGC